MQNVKTWIQRYRDRYPTETGIWKHTILCKKVVFPVIIFLQLRLPIELKFSQVKWLLHGVPLQSGFLCLTQSYLKKGKSIPLVVYYLIFHFIYLLIIFVYSFILIYFSSYHSLFHLIHPYSRVVSCTGLRLVCTGHWKNRRNQTRQTQDILWSEKHNFFN